MEQITLRLGEIIAEPEWNARKQYAPLAVADGDPLARETIEALAADVAQRGLINPLVVRLAGDAYYLVCGFRRYAALAIVAARLAAGEYEERERVQRIVDALPCRVFIGTLRDAKVLNVVENFRCGLRAWELADRLTELRAIDGMSEQQIADATGKSQTYVHLLIALVARLAPEIQRAWRADHPACGLRRLEEWWPLPHDQQVEAFERMCGAEDVIVDRIGRSVRVGNRRGRRMRITVVRAMEACRRAARDASDPQERREAQAAAQALLFALGEVATCGDYYDPQHAERVRHKEVRA